MTVEDIRCEKQAEERMLTDHGDSERLDRKLKKERRKRKDTK